MAASDELDLAFFDIEIQISLQRIQRSPCNLRCNVDEIGAVSRDKWEDENM